MIKTSAMLYEELSDYVNPAAKIRRMTEQGKLFPIIRGLYETDPDVPPYCLSRIIYGPSYISFDYALAWFGLIPEKVSVITAASFQKRKMKTYSTRFGVFTYRDVPSSVYPIGIRFYSEGDYSYLMASPEKALCDKLYTISPRRNRKELKSLLFEDIRIDPSVFDSLNREELLDIASRYHTANHKLLSAYIGAEYAK